MLNLNCFVDYGRNPASALRRLPDVRVLALCLIAAATAGSVFSEEPLLRADVQPAEAGAAPALAPIAPATPATPADSETVSKRLFGVIPNYRAEQSQAVYKPLDAHEKFAIARSDSFDWPNYFLLAGYALQSQMASGGFSHNGGLSGFGRFYSRSVGDQIIGAYVTEAILPSLLHEDPRFFRLGSGPVLHRAYNAAWRVLATRKDNGRNGLNISELAGNAGVVAVTSVYYPESQSPTEGMERYSMALGNDMISNLITEFWPDIRRHLPFRHHD